MKAMVLYKNTNKLKEAELPVPNPQPGQMLVKVAACGVCRTDLHVVDGELEHPKLPLVPGHEIVGTVESTGAETFKFHKGQRVGIPWLGYTCGSCKFCRSGRENLCDNPKFTGYTIDGGFAEYAVADERYCFPIPEAYSNEHAAPLLCAGLIGYRSLVTAGDAERIGFYGFGAAAHILVQVASFQKRKVYAFTRPGDRKGQQFALTLGAYWAGDSLTAPSDELDAAIIFAPVGELVPLALKSVSKGGIVVCAGIHMSQIPSFSYDILWSERTLKSVANLTRKDGEEFMEIVEKAIPHTEVQVFPLHEANLALRALRQGKIQGAAVLKP
jgi:propanol-preferring alcohol dehydrogenase